MFVKIIRRFKEPSVLNPDYRDERIFECKETYIDYNPITTEPETIGEKPTYDVIIYIDDGDGVMNGKRLRFLREPGSEIILMNNQGKTIDRHIF